jgi:di/tripeptidase
VTDSIGGDNIEAAVGDGAENTLIGKDLKQAITNPTASNNVVFNGSDAANLFQALQEVNQNLNLSILAFKTEISLALSKLENTMTLNTTLFNERFDSQGRRISSVEETTQSLRQEVAAIRAADQYQESQIRSVMAQIGEMASKMSTAATQTTNHQAAQTAQQNTADSRILIIAFVVGTSLGAGFIALVAYVMLRGGL